ncbi:hypothetical protein M0802_013145 [Mischocyttarus mexicanus]|nr:hypothetical protein M0802_013161 [Mischocyttarus mexicanus]KAI4484342.1 hypothetical protein M0802_013145 [Mischocyttarus mexicanus]
MATGIIVTPAGRRRLRCWRRLLVRAHLFAAILWLDAILTCSGQKPINLGGVKKRDVYIAGFFPYGNHVPECHLGRGVMPSVKLAVDHINENQTVLRNYRLHMWWNDTETKQSFLHAPFTILNSMDLRQQLNTETQSPFQTYRHIEKQGNVVLYLVSNSEIFSRGIWMWGVKERRNLMLWKVEN